MEAAEGSPLTALNRIPGLRQLVLLTGLALAIAAGVTAAFYVREPGYAMLFSNVSQQEAGEIMNAVMDALAAHSEMSKQALESAQLRADMKDVLLGPGKLWEGLRERGAGSGPRA